MVTATATTSALPPNGHHRTGGRDMERDREEGAGPVLARPADRALLEEVNEHLLCPLCRGYFIDATTIVECLHSFCRSCIVKHLRAKAYCPVCEMMINGAKPNIKPDKALQDIVYKLVPGLFQREMRRRQLFYATRPGQAAEATPEQRGEDTERIIFSPEDVISFSLEYSDRPDPTSAPADGAGSGSASGSTGSDGPETGSESGSGSGGEEPADAGVATRRYLQCPAVVNVAHLKKFLAHKYDVDADRYSVSLLYKRVPLPDYYTLMDVAYIYNWKRNRPMRFFYRVTDLLALRDRAAFHSTERPGSRARDLSRPGDPPDAPSPRSDASSGEGEGEGGSPPPPSDARDGDDARPGDAPSADVEKSQFLNSFELTAKSTVSVPTPDGKADADRGSSPSKRKPDRDAAEDDPPKRPKISPTKDRRKDDVEKAKAPVESERNPKTVASDRDGDGAPSPSKRKRQEIPLAQNERSASGSSSAVDAPKNPGPPPLATARTPPKVATERPAKHPPPKPSATSTPRPADGKAPERAIPQNPSARPPTIARRPDPMRPTKSTERGDPLKSLFDSCNINIPSSLSITLTDQKDDGEESRRGNGDADDGSRSSADQNSSGAPPAVRNYIEILKVPEMEMPPRKTETAEGGSQKPTGKSGDAPSVAKGPVPNLKPITEAKHVKSPNVSRPQTFQQTFLQSLQQQSDKPKYIKTRIDFPKLNQSSPKPTAEGTADRQPPAKRPSGVPEGSKPVPSAQPIKKPIPPIVPKRPKPDSVLDLSTPHAPAQSQLGPQQTKVLETMQSIANLAKRQTFAQRMSSPSQVFSQDSFKMGATSSSSLRIPMLQPQNKHLNKSNSSQNSSSSSPKHFPDYFQPVKSANSNNGNQNRAGSSPHHSNSSSPFSQSSQRTQNRSPSSSPKLVIACPSPKSQSPEQKQLISPKGNENGSQSNAVSSSQMTGTNHTNSDSSKEMKTLKTTKPVPGCNKINPGARIPNSIQKPGTSGNGNAAADILHAHPQLLAQQQYIRHQLELQTQLGYLPPGTAAQWFSNPVARVHFETFMKNMAHNSQLPYPTNPNMKDK